MLELANQVVTRFCARGAKCAVAESLTGGLLAATIVAVPGASRMFLGGIVAYDTAMKAEILRVDREALAQSGPVTAAVAQQMALGAQKLFGSQCAYAVATTGVAGPDADPQTGKPPGLFYVGDVSGAARFQVSGDRDAVRQAAVVAALRRLLTQLDGG